MSSQKKFERFDKKLRLESLLKSTLAGIGGGAIVSFVLAVVFWFLEFDGLLIGIGAFVLLSLACGIAAYCTVFHPTALRSARRLDRYGLDERLVTMVDFEGDDSFIAQKQREDALAHLHALDKKRVKLKVPTVVLTVSIVFAVLFAGMIVVEGLSTAGILPSGADLIASWFPQDPPNMYDLVYKAGAGGSIRLDGEIDKQFKQKVVEGEDAGRILAIADEGYMFYAWNDGETNPSRVDRGVTGDREITALFVQVSDGGEGSDDEDKPDDVPGDEDGMPMPEDGEPGDGGSRYIEVNQVIDGETYFRDVYQGYYELMVKQLEESNLSAEEKAIIEAYFNTIK